MSLPTCWPNIRLDRVVVSMQPGFAQRPNTNKQGTVQLRTNNITPDGRIDISNQEFVTLPERSGERYLLKRGDIIFNNTNSASLVGKTALFQGGGKFTFSNHMTRIRVDENRILPAFLSGYLHLQFKQSVFEQQAKKWVSQAAVDMATLARLSVPLPSLAEQAKIVTILQQAESLHDLNHKATEQAKEIILRLFEEMFLNNPERRTWSVVTIGEAGEV